MENLSSLQYAETVLKSFKTKADHNKTESLTCFTLILASSLAAPLFITLGEGNLFGKITPSVLSVFAAGLTSWLQLRKPQRLWSMYRTVQRLIEDQITKYNFRIDEYESHSNPSSLLAKNVASIALNNHNEWTSIIPTPEVFTLSVEKKSKK